MMVDDCTIVVVTEVCAIVLTIEVTVVILSQEVQKEETAVFISRNCRTETTLLAVQKPLLYD